MQIKANNQQFKSQHHSFHPPYHPTNMHNPQMPQQYPTNPMPYPPPGPQRYVYIDPGNQPYINPTFIPNNENYYTSPVIQNPPVSNGYGVSDQYKNYYDYYNNYYQQNGCGCGSGYYGGQYSPYAGGYGAGYQGQPCGSYQQQPQYPFQSGCGCNNCHQYGLPFINKQRITPNFPSKLGHSYVTSGNQVQNKLVINEPVSQSAPFQTQRRKTYQPYTRKYIEYQDYVQYVPVQKSEWAYKKVMKQIDFVPQEYYETSVETVPRERVDYRVRYVPVEKEFVHVPKDVMSHTQPQQDNVSQLGQQVVRTSQQTSAPTSVIRPDGHFSHSTSSIPLHSSKFIRASNPPVDSKVLHTIYQQNSPRPNIRPAESTVEMVSNARLQPFNPDASQRSGTFGGGLNQQSGYKFPSSGGVVIGGSSQTNLGRENPILSSFGPGSTLPAQNQTQNAVQIGASQVIHSGYGAQGFSQNTNVVRIESQKQVQYSRNFRESGHVESEDFNFDPSEVYKKQSFANRFEEGSN